MRVLDDDFLLFCFRNRHPTLIIYSFVLTRFLEEEFQEESVRIT